MRYNQTMKQNQKGSALIAVIAVVAVAGLLVFTFINFAGKNDDKVDNQKVSTVQDKPESAPELENLGVDILGGTLVTDQAVREFSSMGLKGFYVFGDKLGGKSDTRLNPNFEFAAVKPDSAIIAAVSGKVVNIKEQTGSGDAEIFIQPFDGSEWTIAYDHIVNVKVTKGSSVKAGDVLGNAAVQGNGLNRFEIQVNRDQDGQTTHYCPAGLLKSSVKQSLASELKTLQERWEQQTGLELYDSAAQDPVGCLKTTMTVNEAEGR